MPRSLLLASVLLFIPAAPALAQEVRSQVVHYGDLDLNYAPDANVMVHRIHHAARNVCSNDAGVQTIQNRQDAHDCTLDAEERGVADTGSAVVAGQYYGREPQVIVGEDEPAPPPEAYPYKKS